MLKISSRSARRLLIYPLAAALLATVFGVASAGATEVECTRKPNDGQPGSALKPPVTLSAATQSAQRQENLGTGRDPKVIRNVQVLANRPLPNTFTPDQVNFEALISRSGDNLESVDFPDPTFSQPRISADRKTITFAICLNPEGISAGKYVGAIAVGGPAGLGPATMNLTVTAKDGGLFWTGAILAFVLCLVLLLFKDAAAHFKNPGDNWGTALKQPLTDLRWWGATAIGLGVAFGTLYGAYTNDPAWGASGLAAVIALVGSAVAAIGGKSLASAFAIPPSK